MMKNNPVSRPRKPRRPSPLAGLNPPQRDAVTTRQGPLLVLAGAGTGKTRVVTMRIAELIRHGTAPDRILGVTFTNKAAQEMHERLTVLLGKRLDSRPLIATFHSLCMRVLRQHAFRLGYPKRFAICDRGDQEGYAREVLRETKAPSTLLRPSDLLFRISPWKNSSAPIGIRSMPTCGGGATTARLPPI